MGIDSHNPQQAERKGERGAALVMVLLISFLILVAGMALVATTSLSTTTTVDSTAEMQAYSGAEAGLDAALNVLRGNVAPDASLSGTLMNFRAAVKPSLSDKTSDAWATGSSATARMSGWLNYSYQNPSVANDWRVPLTSSYSPLTGIAYKVEISDPDDPGAIATRQITTNAAYVPTRILIKSEGYGPKGAIKRIEMIVTSTGADLKTPGTIAMAGSPVHLDLGSSAVVSYSGIDLSNPPQSSLPAIAVLPGNEGMAQTAIDAMKRDGQVSPDTAGTITASNSPSFLQSADAARSFLNVMRANATSVGRSFSTKAEAIAAGGLGTTSSPKFTFIDNYSGTAVDLGAGHQGSGLLIVTGDLATNGNTDFEGIILVLGKGNVTRSGGGNGVIRGTIMVANFDPNGAFGTGFGAPSFSIAGGGNSTVGYDSAWIKKALDTLGISVVGVREYHQ
jgi:Tfp pilus assembly protein PilX